MRYIWIFLVLTLLFGYIANYLWQTQAPLNKEKLRSELEAEEIDTNTEAVEFIKENIALGTIHEYIDNKNMAVFFAFAGVSFVSGFGFFHTILDKLFFKKFFEDAEWKVAVRRGFLIYAFLICLVILRLFAGLTWFTLIPLVVLFGLVEYYFIDRTRPSKDIEEEIDKK